ncbi:MAG: hypothetical protein M3153_04520 [Chloroflexota bacterium]|nr:hypothetical protein [Chloroflexota bacterium]
MSAYPTVAVGSRASASAAPRVMSIGLLRGLLLTEAGLALVLAVGLSMVASALGSSIGGDPGQAAEQNMRFAAGAAIMFAILAAVASRGARRRRGWSWTLAALLQLIVAIGTGIAVMTASWHPAYLLGFALAGIVMLVLSTTSVRQGLGQV